MASVQRIKGFDGVRAIAVFGVFLMHKTSWGEHYALGQYGVWLFFLLSGFLITSQLTTARERVEQDGERSISELLAFWWRRSFRILPPYYLLLIIMTLIYVVRHKAIPGLPWHFLYATNWLIEFKTPGGDIGTWGHFWSLAIEEQFYILFAPLVILTPRKWAPWWCALLIVLGVGRRVYMVETGWPPFAIYADSLVNMASLAMGGLAGLFVRKRPVSGEWFGWVTLGLFLLLPFILGRHGWTADYGPIVALVVGMAAIVSLHGNQDGPLATMLSWAPIAYFGRISYGFYLYESYAPAQLGPKLLHHGGFTAELLGAVIALVLSAIVSIASFELFEMPVQRLGRRLKIGRLTPEPPAPENQSFKEGEGLKVPNAADAARG